jgi:hypothetical protein
MKKKGARREARTPPSQTRAGQRDARAEQGVAPDAPDGEARDAVDAEQSIEERASPAIVAQPSPHAHWWDGRVVAFVLGVKALVLFLAAQAYVIAKNERLASLYGWLSIWNRWDAPHYLDLARAGYVKEGVEARWIVFYPLYPWLVRVASFFVRDGLAGAFLVSTIASVAAGLLLYRLARLDEDEWTARASVFFMFVFPTSYFLHIGYTESLFLALALATMLAARARRWPLAGLFGALACMTRANGLALVPALAFEAWEEYRAGGRTPRARALWALVPLAGFGVYLLINWSVKGSPFAFLRAQDEFWYRTFAWPWDGLLGSWRMFRDSAPSDALVVGFQESFFVLLGLGLTVWAWLRTRASYAAWMSCNWLLWSCTKFVLSVPRYTLIMFPAYIIFARAAARRPTAGALIAVWSLLFLALFLARFSQGYWAF